MGALIDTMTYPNVNGMMDARRRCGTAVADRAEYGFELRAMREINIPPPPGGY